MENNKLKMEIDWHKWPEEVPEEGKTYLCLYEGKHVGKRIETYTYGKYETLEQHGLSKNVGWHYFDTYFERDEPVGNEYGRILYWTDMDEMVQKYNKES